ncbi:MAG: hypothetical protein ACREPC_05645, partial [Stenotrophomonas sp.]
RDTPDPRPRSAPTHEITRAAVPPSRVAARSTPANRITAASTQQGGWLHNHWKPSAAGVAARAGHLDTPDAPKASPAAATSASTTAREESGAARTFPVPAWTLRSALTTTPFRIPRPTLTIMGAGKAATPPAPPQKQRLAARTDKVLQDKGVPQKRRQAPRIPVAPQETIRVATHAALAPAQQKAPPTVVAQPAMVTTTKVPDAPPPPPPLPQDVSPKRVVAGSGAVFAELKSRMFATTKSLDDSATETFGTGSERTGDAAKRASLDAGRQGVNPAKAAAQSLQSELALAMERRRKQLGEKPAKTRIASEGPAAIRPQPNAAAKADTLIKPRPVALGPQLISKQQKANVFEELQKALAARIPQRAM